MQQSLEATITVSKKSTEASGGVERALEGGLCLEKAGRAPKYLGGPPPEQGGPQRKPGGPQR